MENKYALVAKNLSKYYKVYKGNREKISDLFSFRERGEKFYALKNLNFKVEKGDVVGLVGLNGSGKSTLSNIIGGISEPSEGELFTDGEQSLISISSGLNNQLTGLENIELKGLMMGLDIKEINRLKPSIIDFADIGMFINQPVKTYSSGMKSRLGFSIAVNINTDILIIDEALSVGDPTFSSKCLDKINEFREKGKTIFFVSHSVPQVKSFCTKAIWLEYGVMKAYGTVDEVMPMYERFLSMFNKMTESERKEYREKTVENHNHLLLK